MDLTIEEPDRTPKHYNVTQHQCPCCGVLLPAASAAAVKRGDATCPRAWKR